MKIKKGFVLRSVGGENIVVPVGEVSKQFHGMIKLNESGAFLWNFYKEEHTKEQGVEALLAEYEVDKETAERDVTAFLDTLVKHKFSE